MDAAPDTRRQLGQIMVEEGFLTAEQLQAGLVEHDRTGKPLGKVLVDLGFVSPGAVANALAEQHGGLLKTEYGTSAGLRERAAGAPFRADVAQPTLPTPTGAPAPQAPAQSAPLGAGLRLAQPVAAEPAAEAPAAAAAPPELQPEPPAPEAEVSSAARASSARIEELESQLHSALTERNSLAQSFNELQVRLNEAAQAHEAGVSAEVAERVGAIESRLQAAMAGREELERGQQLSASRIAELETQLQSAAAERSEVEEVSSTQIAELNGELQELRTGAAEREGGLERTAGLEAELEQLRARDDHGDGRQAAEIEALRVQLQEVAEKRDAAEARASALENDLTPLRSELESLREHGADEGFAARVSELSEALHAASAERDAAVERAAALEPELASLRDRVEGVAAERDAALAGRAGTDPEAGALREQLVARERRLAESVGEIAKLNGEHRALLQLVERQFQLEESTTAVPETKGEAAHVLFVPTVTGYTLVEQAGAAPEAGDVVELDAGRFVVRRLGPSPLPGPRRRCAYLERV